MNNIIKINNVELEFDFTDADDLERFENAVEKAQKDFESISTIGKKASETIRESCKCIFDCFNTIFGDGTDKKIFGNKTNFNVCMQAFKDLVDAKFAQENQFANEINELEKKYSPNRATRRSKK